jgi:hypothetical protein
MLIKKKKKKSIVRGRHAYCHDGTLIFKREQPLFFSIHIVEAKEGPMQLSDPMGLHEARPHGSETDTFSLFE